ncbi:MAG TPA: hypothetical protein VJU87_03495 [Gemmatimonadaceae bacterium]|nr:hypothetical protein [Gemmatimonadaceae bacterium]
MHTARRALGAIASVALGLVSMWSCEPRGHDRPHTNLDASASQLRAAFNADSGKVRVVMLLSPT